MQPTLHLLATLSCALFAGAALYINLVEHPARMSLGTQIAATGWAPSYARATRMQAPLAATGSLAAIAAWIGGSSVWWLAGGVLLGLVIPFTLVAIMPTNHRLAAADLDKTSAEARALLDRWNALHGVRTALSVAALVVFLLAP